MDVKLDDKLESQGYETIEPLPGETMPPWRKFF